MGGDGLPHAFQLAAWLYAFRWRLAVEVKLPLDTLMNVDGHPYRTVWKHPEIAGVIQIIDQRGLPFRFEIEDLRSVDHVATAIADMHVRGAGCIGATAGYGMYLAALEAASNGGRGFDDTIERLAEKLEATRPTAVNLRWAVQRQLEAMAAESSVEQKVTVSLATAEAIADEDADACRRIGEYGLPLLERIAASKRSGEPVHVLTHCNAGWLAFVDHGSATAPIYAAHDCGIALHVWVDETRPRNQGARLTAWELGQHGVPHTVIVDNAGGHLMQQGKVDLVITGTDRTTRNGDVANKIGTYLKALAAHDNGIPFYVALPSSTFDWERRDGREIPIEERSAEEVASIGGLSPERGREEWVRLVNGTSPSANPAFDVTPSRLVTGLITERGVCAAGEAAILGLFPERRKEPPV